MNKLIKNIEVGEYEIHDESLYANCVNSYSKPKDKFEVSKIIKLCKENNVKITVNGALTALSGAGVPFEGHSMSTKNLNKMLYNKNNDSIEVGSGCTFEDIETFITLNSKGKREFPVSPTEKTATIGGALSINSSGLRSFRLGRIVDYVEEIEICNQNGDFVRYSNNDKEFKDYIASEGMLGVITSIKLLTTNKYNSAWGILFFFESDIDSMNFVDSIETIKEIQTIEYIDKSCFILCEKYKPAMTIIESIPKIDDKFVCGIYVEIYGEQEDSVEEIAEILMEKSTKNNSNSDYSWAMSKEDMFKLQNYRHAISECFNIENAKYNSIDSRIKFLNIDIRWGSKSRIELINYYHSVFDNTNLDFYIFGHIGSKAPYVNILAKTNNEYLLAKNLIKKCYQNATNKENNIFNDFGIGKLKKEFFCNFERLEKKNLKLNNKLKYDSAYIFNPSNMF